MHPKEDPTTYPWPGLRGSRHVRLAASGGTPSHTPSGVSSTARMAPVSSCAQTHRQPSKYISVVASDAHAGSVNKTKLRKRTSCAACSERDWDIGTAVNNCQSLWKYRNEPADDLFQAMTSKFSANRRSTQPSAPKCFCPRREHLLLLREICMIIKKIPSQRGSLQFSRNAFICCSLVGHLSTKRKNPC